MKLAATISRYLLGLTFLVFGLNGFLQFLHMPAPTGVAAQFLGALVGSNYIAPVMLLQIVGGVLLLAGRFVPLALVILAPIVVNILLFHVTMAPQGLPLAVIVLVLWLLTYTQVRRAFTPLLASKTS